MHTNRSNFIVASNRIAPMMGALAVTMAAGVAIAGPMAGVRGMAQGLSVVATAQSAQPGFVVATQGGANMRCSDSDRFYVVARIPEGTVLRSEGMSGNWTIVRYPAGTPAFVRVEHVRVEGDIATTTEATQLKAVNSASGFPGSYKSLLAQPLPVGSRLKVIEAVREGDGIVAYRVVAPDSALGYIDSSSLRVATEAEAKAAAAAMGIATQPAAPSPAPATPTAPVPTPAPTPATGEAPATVTPPAPAPTETPVTTPGASGATPAVDLRQPGGVPPAVPSGTPTTTDPSASPVTITQGGANPQVPGSENAATGAATSATPGDVAPVDPVARRVGTVEQLEQTFQRVWREPAMTSEVDELIAEYERAIARETSDGRRRALSQRLEALKIRKDFRDRAIRQQEELARYEDSRPRLTEQLLIVERGRVYTIIGELQPSTVYDGERLPLMFRIVSVGGVAPRTLGYLRPTQEFPLKQMVGQVVGVIGDATLDPSLKLNVITPVRVDVMRPGELGRVETRELPWPGEVARPDAGEVRPVPPMQPVSPASGGENADEEAPRVPAVNPAPADRVPADPVPADRGGDSGDGGLIPVPPR